MEQSTPNSSLNDAVRLERVRIFFGHAIGNMAGILIGSLLLGAVMYQGGVDHTVLALWFTALTFIVIAILAYQHHVRLVGLSDENCDRKLRIRIGIGACIGILFGASGYLLPASNTLMESAFIFMIVSTMITVSALGFAVLPSYFIILNFVSLFPITLLFGYRYLSGHGSSYLMLMIFSALWQVVVLSKVRRVSRTAMEAIVLNLKLQAEIEEHKISKEALQHIALHDPLTALPNRRYYEETIERSLSLAHRSGNQACLIYIDLDGFKHVNDTFGHHVGDLLLTSVAKRIQGTLRDSDFCARLGGDEFAVIVLDIKSEEDAKEVANKLREAISEPLEIPKGSLRPAASLGWAIYPIDGTDSESLSREADRRMYKAKRQRN